jgi:hypothetical protein
MLNKDTLFDAGIEMFSKSIACVLTAIALTGCCAFGTGCNAPTAVSPVAWDGLNEPRQEETPKQPPARRKKEVAVTAQTNGDLQAFAWPKTKGELEQQEAAERADDARLTKKLKICNGCSTAPEKKDDATNSSGR